jgi:hypothetical protein
MTLLQVRQSLDRLYQDFWRQRTEVRHSDADILLNQADFGPLPRGLPVVTFQPSPKNYDSGLT